MTALITGASSGIGEAFARRLAADGHDLFLVARSGDKLKSLCDELSVKHGITSNCIAADLGERGSDQIVFDETTHLGLDIDLLVNNAGFGSMGDFVELDRENELAMIDLNVRTLVALTHRYLPAMREKRRGTIINVSSTAGEQPLPFMAAYAATKAFVSSFTEAIAEENRPYGIQIFALCPGPTRTNFFEAGNIDQSLAVKGEQTAEEVVEVAMAAIGAGRSKVISGWMNRLVAGSTKLVPNSLITKVVGSRLRKNFQKETLD
jgi:uncharacterized protein